MKVLTRGEQDYLVDILAAIRVALVDMDDDPVRTAAFIDGKISGILVPAIGGKKGVERAVRTIENLGKAFKDKGIERGKV